MWERADVCRLDRVLLLCMTGAEAVAAVQVKQSAPQCE